MIADAGLVERLRPLILDVLDHAEGRSMSVTTVAGMVNFLTDKVWPNAAVALALEGLVGEGLAHRVRVQSHGGAVSRVRYRAPQPEQLTFF